MRPCEMENFRLVVFYDKTCVKENFKYDIVTTKKKRKRQFIALLLRN